MGGGILGDWGYFWIAESPTSLKRIRDLRVFALGVFAP